MKTGFQPPPWATLALPLGIVLTVLPVSINSGKVELVRQKR